jgi:hypothetical protein
MKSISVKVVLLTLLVVGFAMQTKAQKVNSEPIFGSLVIKKSSTDSTKRKSNFHLFRPAFLRVGTMGGVAIPFDNSTNREVGGTMGLRLEYGLSNRISLLGEVQANGNNGFTFPSAQTSLGINLMPFKSKRLQPYVGVSFGVGGDGGNDRNNSGKNDRRDGKYEMNGIESTDSTETYRKDGGFQAFGQMRLGLNYVIAQRFISTFETTYQLPFNNSTTSNGGVVAKIGLSYQFGKKSK